MIQPPIQQVPEQTKHCIATNHIPYMAQGGGGGQGGDEQKAIKAGQEHHGKLADFGAPG